MKQLGTIYRKLSSRKRGLGDKIRSCEIINLWDEVVGDKISLKTEATGLAGGVLLVNVENSAWANELLFLKKEILQKINLREQQVKDIKFRIGSKITKREKPLPARALEIEDISAGLLERLNQKREKLNQERLKDGWKKCETCGELFNQRQEGGCFFCQKSANDETRRRVFQILKSSPWKGYAYVRNQGLPVAEQEYNKIRSIYRQYIRGEIENIIREMKKEREQGKLKSSLRAFAVDYTLLKNQKLPAEINEQMIKEALGSKILKFLEEKQKGRAA